MKEEKINVNTIGINTWGTATKNRGRASKQDLIFQIGSITGTKSLDIGSLNLAELTKILKVAKSAHRLNGEVPTGRLKQPYLTDLSSLFTGVKLDKLSVNALQQLTKAFHI